MMTAAPTVARVNGVALHEPGEMLTGEELRQRACTELLRQAAQRDGLLDAADPAPLDGAISTAAAAAIERWLDQALTLPEPTPEACRRHHAANAPRYTTGERVRLRHVLFAVTPGVDVTLLRKRAEACLLDLRCHAPGEDDRFAATARELSNCPSGADGGDLGWLGAEDCVPEFAKELFGQPEVGVLARLVHSRFGLHVVEVLERHAGTPQAFEEVQGAVQLALRQQAWGTALRQCLQLLAGDARLEGVDLDAAATPLVQ